MNQFLAISKLSGIGLVGLVLGGILGMALAPKETSKDKLSEGAFPKETVQKLDSAITKVIQQNNIPSAAVGIWVPGEGRYLLAKGMADLQTKSSRQIEQPFRIASLTKTFTATAVLRLVDQGKLSKSDKLAKWYPKFPNANKITVNDLLRMRSGIPDPSDTEVTSRFYDDPLMNYSGADWIKEAASKVNQFKEPNRETVYANVNYILLGEIVKKGYRERHWGCYH